jgi:hypothetical protein
MNELAQQMPNNDIMPAYEVNINNTLFNSCAINFVIEKNISLLQQLQKKTDWLQQNSISSGITNQLASHAAKITNWEDFFIFCNKHNALFLHPDEVQPFYTYALYCCACYCEKEIFASIISNMKKNHDDDFTKTICVQALEQHGHCLDTNKLEDVIETLCTQDLTLSLEVFKNLMDKVKVSPQAKNYLSQKCYSVYTSGIKKFRHHEPALLAKSSTKSLPVGVDCFNRFAISQ